jgi:hypothetical protein
VKAGQLARLKTILGDDMPQYLVAIHHPDNYDPSAEGEAMARDIDVLNEEMEATGQVLRRRPAIGAPREVTA